MELAQLHSQIKLLGKVAIRQISAGNHDRPHNNLVTEQHNNLVLD